VVTLEGGRWWPSSAEELMAVQRALAAVQVEPWNPPGDLAAVRVGACFVCFERGSAGPGQTGDRGWAAAAVRQAHRIVETVTVSGVAPAPYVPGLLALREGPLQSRAIGALREPPDVCLVDATGRDHPRHAGLALHLGAATGVPTVGITNRTLVATGVPPVDQRFARSPLVVDGGLVGCSVRTRPGAHPVAVHAGWRTDPDTAFRVVVAAVLAHRTPEPLRAARRAARVARATDV
jgi:deoxyribonuclease V